MPEELIDEVEESGGSVDKEFRKQDNARADRHLKDTECRHTHWIKRCSFCKTIMESDCQHNVAPGSSQKVMYTDFDTLVASYELSKKLKSLKIVQKSKFYWVETNDTNILSLRSKENVTLRDAQYASAFTSSELVRMFYRLPAALMTPEVWEYVGRNAHDPNRLARLLLQKRQ